MWQGWLNLILGVWLIISGFVSPLQSPANLIIVGILAAVFGFWSYKNWQGDVIGILGPANFIIVGVLMIIAGLWEGLSHPKPTPYTP
jgi:hypothetical protein